MSDQSIDPMVEIDAMRNVADTLSKLDQEAARRVLRWAADRYGADQAAAKIKLDQNKSQKSEDEEELDYSKYDDLPEFYSRINPQTDADKVLVVSYWMQYIKGNVDIDAQDLNTELKQMGYRIGNITRAFTNLVKRKPQPIVQIRKTGPAKQGRKKFKITSEGKKIVEEMVKNS